MNWDERASHAAQFVDHDPDVIDGMEYADGYVDGAIAGAAWQRRQLRTDEAVERVARAMHAHDAAEGIVVVSWGESYEQDDDYRRAARAATTALLEEG